ncbi:hypothetical protein [Bacterioplanoides sp. SCSIO 12839]|uniref:hypothetical protein n=1 Tax=Bacterioplanoides sp. SCSIO 12839 TaxID=2829569 RepID=UPI002101EB21|nr:hypothetical protein [Bacterioplanoides sp. SCSIO 12839]UTW49818.1 hypothetical protein KFF03_08050 [Bacterioplanoides sp. SCSIO 12839]
MSAVIKTATPFLIESVLIQALEALGVEPQKVSSEMQMSLAQRNQIQTGDILTNRSDYNGRQLFRRQGERWILLHDGDEMNGRVVSQLTNRRYTAVSKFLVELGDKYETAYKAHLEDLAEKERIRLEEERKARVEATRQQAIEKARAQGYSVKESRNAKGQIQLVLTRTVS